MQGTELVVLLQFNTPGCRGSPKHKFAFLKEPCWVLPIGSSPDLKLFPKLPALLFLHGSGVCSLSPLRACNSAFSLPSVYAAPIILSGTGVRYGHEGWRGA